MLFLWGDMMKVKLGDIGAILTGNTPKTSDGKNYISKDINFIKPSDIDEDKITNISTSDYFISELAKNDARILPVGSILVTCIGIIGKVGINSIECAFNQQINAIIPDTRKCNNKFLAYAIQFKKNELQQLANAPVVPILNKTQFSNIQICLPLIEKQNKIVAILDMINEIINKRQQQLKKLDELVKSRFIEMFGDLVINSMSWKGAKIGDNCFVTKLAGFEYTQYINYSDSGDVVMVKAQNIKNGKLNGKELSFISKEVSDSLPRSQLAPGDVVMTYVGANIGDVAVIDDKYKYHLAPNVAKIRPDLTVLNSTYLMYMLMFLNAYIVNNSADTAKAALSMERIRELKIFIPPLNLQNQFADFVEQTDKSKLEIKKSLDKLEILKKSLMQEYFS